MRSILISLFILVGILVKAQDPYFSQFYANPMYLAASFAGMANGPRFVINFRDQWPKVPGNFVTYSFSVDHYFSNINSGMAVYALSDNAGDGKIVTTNIGYAYSYKVKITPDFVFQPGIAAYYYSKVVNYGSISFADEFFGDEFIGSSSEVLPSNKIQHTDFAISGIGYLENYWFGFNVDHIMTVSPILRDDIRYLDMRVALFGGMKYDIKRRTRNKLNEFVQGAFNYRYQSSVHQLDIGAYYNRNPLILGLWYRGIPFGNEYVTADALVYLLGVKYKGYIFSYSYDMTIGGLISTTGGSHEISIIYRLNDKANNRGKRYKEIPCPEL